MQANKLIEFGVAMSYLDYRLMSEPLGSLKAGRAKEERPRTSETSFAKQTIQKTCISGVFLALPKFLSRFQLITSTR